MDISLSRDHAKVRKHLVETGDASPIQREVLTTRYGANSHLIAVAVVNDDPEFGVDYLCLDDEVPAQGHTQIYGHYPPYVLTWDGRIMELHRYYNLRRDVSVPFVEQG